MSDNTGDNTGDTIAEIESEIEAVREKHNRQVETDLAPLYVRLAKLTSNLFADTYGLREGDTVIVTPAFHAELVRRKWPQHHIDTLPLGTECKIKSLYAHSGYPRGLQNRGTLSYDDGYSETGVDAVMLKEMRAAFLHKADE